MPGKLSSEAPVMSAAHAPHPVQVILLPLSRITGCTTVQGRLPPAPADGLPQPIPAQVRLGVMQCPAARSRRRKPSFPATMPRGGLAWLAERPRSWKRRLLARSNPVPARHRPPRLSQVVCAFMAATLELPAALIGPR